MPLRQILAKPGGKAVAKLPVALACRLPLFGFVDDITIFVSDFD
jgi:hypothetical protein